MAYNPWMTSNDIIEAVKRKIAFPVSQNTFSEEDILRFANEEMFISQVPSVLQYHEEYFVYRVQTPLVSNISRYSIPDRAIGMRLRDLMWTDSAGNFFEMTRINADDKAFFQRNIGANQAIHKFYVENNDVVLTPSVVGDPTGFLNFFIFMRPNQLVKNDRSRTIQSFTQDITVNQAFDYQFQASDVNTVNNTISINSYQFTSAAVNTSTDTFTIASHGYSNGMEVALLGNDLPAPLVANTKYYIVASTLNTFKLATIINGSPVDLTASGSGAMTIGRVFNYSEKQKVYFFSSNTLPAGLNATSAFYVIPVSLIEFKVSADPNGEEVDITSVGIGNHIMSSNGVVITPATQTPQSVSYAFDVLPRFLTTEVSANIQSAITAAAIDGVSASIKLDNVFVTFQDATDTVTYNSHGLLAGDTVVFNTITTTTGISSNTQYYVLNPTTNTFQLSLTAGGPAVVLTNNGSGTMSGAIVVCLFDDITTSFVALNETAISVSSQLGFTFGTELSSLYSVGSKIDFLQTKPGHKTYVFDVRIKAITNPSVGVYSLKVNRSDLLVPLSTGYNFPELIANIQTGDYVCLAGESIIPQLPPDLHNMLAEKTAARILASLGDQAGLAMANDKIKEMEYRQGTLLNDRVDGAPQKITSRHSLLRYGKMGVRKRM